MAILDTFGYYDDDATDFNTMKSDILEDLDNGFSPWYHIHHFINALLPDSYQYSDKSVCPLIQHVKRTRRVGLSGMMYDEDVIYNLDAIIVLKNIHNKVNSKNK